MRLSHLGDDDVDPAQFNAVVKVVSNADGCTRARRTMYGPLVLLLRDIFTGVMCVVLPVNYRGDVFRFEVDLQIAPPVGLVGVDAESNQEEFGLRALTLEAQYARDISASHSQVMASAVVLVPGSVDPGGSLHDVELGTASALDDGHTDGGSFRNPVDGRVVAIGRLSQLIPVKRLISR